MFAILVHLRPLDPKTGARVDVRVASSPGPAFQGLGGFVWESAIIDRPRAAIELFDLDLSPGTRTGTATLSVSLPAIQEVETTGLSWGGAPVTIYRADDLVWPAPVEFQGIVQEASPDLDEETLAFTCKVSTALLETPVLALEFGDTDFDFDAEKRTTLLPAGFGTCYNVEPIFFDTIRNIGMIDGYGNTISIAWLGEGLSSLGASVGNYASYAALAAAVDAEAIPPGRWATCIAEGMIALGAPPAGVITCHAIFGFGMTGALAQRLITTHAGIATSMVETAAFDALDSYVPYPIHYWTADQEDVKDLLERIAGGCNASLIFTLQNKISVVRPFGGALIAEFQRYGFNDPPVRKWDANPPLTPTWRLALRTARPVRVLQISEINYVDDLIDRGLYDAAETYRQGHIVWLRNKSEWLYVNATPGSGHTPPDGTAGDAYWQLMAPSPNAADLVYVDGTTIDDLQPAEAGATLGAPAGTPVGAITADDVSGTINSGGGVADNQVSTGAIAADGVTIPWIVRSGTVIVFASGIKTQVLAVTVVKEEDDSVLDVYAQLPLYGSDAVQVYVTYEAQQAGIVIDSRLFTLRVDGNDVTYLPFGYEHPFDTLDAGTYDVKVFVERFGTNSCQTVDEYHMRVREYKR